MQILKLALISTIVSTLILFCGIVAFAAPPSKTVTVDAQSLNVRPTIGPLFANKDNRVTFKVRQQGTKFDGTGYWIGLAYGTNGAKSASATIQNGSTVTTNGVGTIDFASGDLTASGDFWYNVRLTNASETIVIGEGWMQVRPSL